MGIFRGRYHSKWLLIRDTSGEDAATFAACIALATNEGDFANLPDSAYQIQSAGAGEGPHEGYSAGDRWMFAFCGTDAENETFSFNLVCWARANGMAQVICEGNGILGTQDVVLYPDDDATATNAFWADTLTLDETTKWPTVAVYNAGGDNEVAILVADLCGAEYVYPFIYDAGGGSEATSITVFGRPY